MNKQKLFLYTLEDLKLKLDSNNPYQILKSSELMRTLLFDTTGPLVDKINREFRLKIKFHHRDTVYEYNLFKPETFFILDGFYPKNARPNAKTVETNKSQFFKALVMVINNKTFTVKDVLDHAVNCLGGTHHGEPKDQEKEALKQLESYSFGNLDANSIIKQIHPIGYVILDALQELKEKVIENYKG